MYRCKDCGQEFKEKVDYCDCGNNTFEYIEDFVPKENPVKISKQPRQPLTIEEKSQIISWLFFAICLFISLIVWLIPVKVEQTIINDEIKEQIDTKSIPNLEKIWNNTPPKVEIKQKEKPQSVLDEIREEIPDKIIPKTDIKKPVQNKPVIKPVQQAKPVVQNKPVTQNKQNLQKQNNQNKPITQNKPVTQNKTPQQSSKQSATKPKQTSNPNNLKPLQQQTSKPAETKPVEKSAYNPNSLEMLKYKGSLRSALFAKLPVGSIQGSGSCSVQFAVDKTGKLINRGFSKQSDNKSLNDAVYYMLMSVPRFASPPEGYNQELIRMNINMHSDGSYEISIN